MKKYIITVLFVCINAVDIHAQMSLSYSIGYGNYKMKNMSQLLNTSLGMIQSSLPAGVRITADFPGYMTHNLDVAYLGNRHDIGIKGTYMTTGGKIAYADYSGKYYEKLILNGYRIGVLYRAHFIRTQMGEMLFSLFGEVSPAMTFTRLKYKALISFPDYNVHETDFIDNVSRNETGFSIQPLMGGELLVTNHIFTSVTMGYDFEFGLKLFASDNIIKTDWSGFRVNAGIGYRF